MPLQEPARPLTPVSGLFGILADLEGRVGALSSQDVPGMHAWLDNAAFWLGQIPNQEQQWAAWIGIYADALQQRFLVPLACATQVLQRRMQFIHDGEGRP